MPIMTANVPIPSYLAPVLVLKTCGVELPGGAPLLLIGTPQLGQDIAWFDIFVLHSEQSINAISNPNFIYDF